jgi:hygromycin-B 7''-O-kinase
VKLPVVETLDEYRAIYHREDLWRPVVEAICTRHALPHEHCLRGPDGTHIVYFVGSTSVIKLFVPLFESDFTAERLVSQVIGGRLSVATPAVTAEGEIGGWRYLILTRVQGTALERVWSDLSVDDRRSVIREVGELIRSLRAVALEGLEALAVDWEAFVRTRVNARDEELSKGGVGLADSISSYVGSSPLSRAEAFRAVLLFSDVTLEHVMVARTGSTFRVVGYVDFGDAMIGPPEYELVAPGVDIVRGDRGLLRELLVAVGYSPDQLKGELQHRLMTCTLVHRYLTLEDLMSLIPEARAATTVDELAGIVWPV